MDIDADWVRRLNERQEAERRRAEQEAFEISRRMLAMLEAPDGTTTTDTVEVRVTCEDPKWYFCKASFLGKTSESWARTREKALATALRRLARTIELNSKG